MNQAEMVRKWLSVQPSSALQHEARSQPRASPPLIAGDLSSVANIELNHAREALQRLALKTEYKSLQHLQGRTARQLEQAKKDAEVARTAEGQAATVTEHNSELRAEVARIRAEIEEKDTVETCRNPQRSSRFVQVISADNTKVDVTFDWYGIVLTSGFNLVDAKGSELPDQYHEIVDFFRGLVGCERRKVTLELHAQADNHSIKSIHPRELAVYSAFSTTQAKDVKTKKLTRRLDPLQATLAVQNRMASEKEAQVGRLQHTSSWATFHLLSLPSRNEGAPRSTQ